MFLEEATSNFVQFFLLVCLFSAKLIYVEPHQVMIRQIFG